MEEYLYLVTYEIRDDERQRQVFKLMEGYGEWLHSFVFHTDPADAGTQK